MQQIERYMDYIGKKLQFSKTETRRHTGENGFYHDGTYQVDLYQILGTTYQLGVKTTGRREFYLYDGSKLIGYARTQKELIQQHIGPTFG